MIVAQRFGRRDRIGLTGCISTHGIAMLHELWMDDTGREIFCYAGPDGDEIRSYLGNKAKLVWTVDAGSHYEAMTKYYEYRGRGRYVTKFEDDYLPYDD